VCGQKAERVRDKVEKIRAAFSILMKFSLVLFLHFWFN